MTAWRITLLPQVVLLVDGDAEPAGALVKAVERLGCEANATAELAALQPDDPVKTIAIRCQRVRLPPVNPEEQGATFLFFHDGVRVSLSADRRMVFVFDGQVRVDLAVDGGLVVCSFTAGWQADIAFVRTSVPVLLCLLLWLHGYYYIHGALLSLPDVGTVLLLGESGAGKSTTLLAMLQHGARWFTDDMAFVGPDGMNGSGLYGLPRDFHLTETTLTAFPHVQPLVLKEPRFRQKASVRVSASLPAAQREASSPVTLVVLEPRGTSFSAQPLDQSDVFLVLLRASAWGAVPGMPRTTEHHAALQHLTCRARGFRVSLQENSVGDVTELLRLLSLMPLA